MHFGQSEIASSRKRFETVSDYYLGSDGKRFETVSMTSYILLVFKITKKKSVLMHTS